MQKGGFLLTFFICCGVYGYSLTSGAAEGGGTSKLKSKISKTKKKTSNPFSASMSINYESNFYEQSDRNNFSSTSYSLSPGYKINDDLNLSSTLKVTQYVQLDNQSALNNIPISLSRSPISINSDTSYSYSITGTLPTKEEEPTKLGEDRKNRTFLGALKLATSLSYKTSLLQKNTTLSLGASIKRNFHELDIRSSGTPNIVHLATLESNAGLQLSKVFNLALNATYQPIQYYNGTIKELFHLSQSITAKLNKKTSLSLLHYNFANIIKENGASNIGVFDERSSAFSANATYKF